MTRLWICEGYTEYWICLNKPDYALMSQNAWTCLNKAEYYWIYRHIPEKECWIYQNYSQCVWCNAWMQVHNQKFFRAEERAGVVELDTLINISSKTQELHQGNILEFFLLYSLYTTFWMENLTQWWVKVRIFLFQIRTLFRFSERTGQGRLHLSSLVARLWVVAEYASVSLNMPKYPENAWINCSDYARALDMHDHLTCSTDFWICLQF